MSLTLTSCFYESKQQFGSCAVVRLKNGVTPDFSVSCSAICCALVGEPESYIITDKVFLNICLKHGGMLLGFFFPVCKASALKLCDACKKKTPSFAGPLHRLTPEKSVM